MATYEISIEEDLMRIGFGEPASNAEIVRDVEELLNDLRNSGALQGGALQGGALLKINGPSSLPVMAVIIHKVVHLYGAIGIYDPKLKKFVISVTHDPAYQLGELID
jgi:CRISPR-associated protein Csx3